MIRRLLLACYVFAMTAPPYAEASFWSERKAATERMHQSGRQIRRILPLESEVQNPVSDLGFSIPESVGTVVESWTEGSPQLPVILHIQDAHNHFAAQKNLARVLNAVAETSADKTALSDPLPVYVEGAWTRIETAFLGAFPDERLREKSAQTLLKKNRIRGEEYFAILHPGAIAIHGVEDPDLYQANVTARDSARSSLDARISEINSERALISQAKMEIYPPSLRELDLVREKVDAQQNTLKDLLRLVIKTCPKTWAKDAFPELKKFLDAAVFEDQVSSKGLEGERAAVQKILSENLTGSQASDFLNLCLQFRLGKVSSRVFHSRLASMARAFSIHVPNLDNLVQGLNQSGNIGYDKIEKELDELMISASAELIESQVRPELRQRANEIYGKDRTLSFNAKCLKWQVSSNEWHRRRNEIESINQGQVKFMAESYYDLALRRDRAMVENLSRCIKPGTRSAILIAGGYHTEGITELLKAKGFRYLVIRPSLQIESGESSAEGLSSLQAWDDLKSAYAGALEKILSQDKEALSVREAVDVLKTLDLSVPVLIDGKPYALGHSPFLSPSSFAWPLTGRGMDGNYAKSGTKKIYGHTLRSMSAFNSMGSPARLLPEFFAAMLQNGGESMEDLRVLEDLLHDGMTLELPEGSHGAAGGIIKLLSKVRFVPGLMNIAHNGSLRITIKRDRLPETMVTPASIFYPYRKAVLEKRLPKPQSWAKKTAMFLGELKVTAVWETVLFRILPVLMFQQGGSIHSQGWTAGALTLLTLFPLSHSIVSWRVHESEIKGRSAVKPRYMANLFVHLGISLFLLVPFFQFSLVPAAAVSLGTQMLLDFAIDGALDNHKNDNRHYSQAMPYQEKELPSTLEVTNPDLVKWREILNSPAPLGRKECMAILNIAKAVINNNFIRPRTLVRYLHEVGRTNRQLTILSRVTADRLILQVENGSLDPDLAHDLVRYARELKKFAGYSLIYRLGMTRVSNYRQLSGYGLPVGGHRTRFKHLMEGFIRPFAWMVQKFWGFSFGMFVVRKQFFGAEGNDGRFWKKLFGEGHLSAMLNAGNEVEPSLYPEAKNIKKVLFEEMRHLNIQTAEFDNELTWPWRKIMTRIFGLSFVVLLLDVSVYGFNWLVYGAPFTYTLSSAIISAGRAVLFSIFMSWSFILFGMRDSFYAAESKKLKSLENRISEAEQRVSESSPSGGKTLLQSEYLRTLSSADKEKSMSAPSADIILLVTPPGRTESAELRGILEGRGKGLLRQDVPVITLPSQREGSGMGYLNSMQYLHSPEFEMERSKHPHLRGRSLDDLRVLVLLADEPSVKSAATPLSLPFLDRAITPLEFSLLNGYKACQAMSGERRGGVAVMFSDELFISPIQVQNGITLLTSWVGYKDLVDQNMDLMVVDRSFRRVQKFYPNAISEDPMHMKNRVERQAVTARYDLSNPVKKQMIAFTGGFVASFADASAAESFYSANERIRRQVNDRRRRSYPIDLESHLLAPMVIASNREDVYSYLAKHRNGRPLALKSREWAFFSGLMQAVEQSQGIEVNASVPYPTQSAFYFTRTKEGVPYYDDAQIAQLWKDLGVADEFRSSSVQDDSKPSQFSKFGDQFRVIAVRTAVLILFVFSNVPPVSRWSASRLEAIAVRPEFNLLQPETRSQVRIKILGSRARSGPVNGAGLVDRHFEKLLNVLSAERSGTLSPGYFVVNLNGLLNRTEQGFEFREELSDILTRLDGRMSQNSDLDQGSGFVFISDQPREQIEELAASLGVSAGHIRIIAPTAQSAEHEIRIKNGSVKSVLSCREPGTINEMKKIFKNADALLLTPFFAEIDHDYTVHGGAASEIYKGLEQEGLISDRVHYSPKDQTLILEGRAAETDLSLRLRRVRYVRIQA